MALTLKPGTRLYSAVCATELIVVRAPADAVELTIGGVAALTDASEPRDASGVVEGHGGGAQMGKRYVDDDGTLELLCTRPGDGLPAAAGAVLGLKSAKPLPASD
jgi:hypothetical protein